MINPWKFIGYPRRNYEVIVPGTIASWSTEFRPSANMTSTTMRRHSAILLEESFIVRWLVVFRIYVASAVFNPYRDLEAGDNQSLKIQVARPGIEPRSSCSVSQELNHSDTAAPFIVRSGGYDEYGDIMSAKEIYTGIKLVSCDALNLLMPDLSGTMLS